MTSKQNIKAEASEINRMINGGVSFEVEVTIKRRKPGILGCIRKREQAKEKRKYTIYEPTLAVLDRLAAEQIKMEIDEKEMQSDLYRDKARRLAHDHAMRAARCLAILVVGEEGYKAQSCGSYCRYIYDHKKVDKLTTLFAHSIEPSKLTALTLLANTISNLGDFTNSIRLMSAARITAPVLVEENGKD